MNKVLETTHLVIEKARHVTINQETLEEICKRFKPSEIKTWTDEAPFTYPRLSDLDELSFILTFNSVNFCYWGNPKWTVKHEVGNLDGAWAMIASFRRAIQEGFPILNANYLETMSEEDLLHILRGDPTIPLFKERLDILQEIGSILNNKYNGRFVHVVESADRDAIKLLDILTTDFPSYHDTSTYDDRKVFFHKRAQLAISDIYIEPLMDQDLETWLT